METAPSAEVIRATQETLGKFVKRPVLSEKVLRKPPFRFLHDIITCVLHNHGFFEGLFDDSELNSENVKDRESKLSFLNKVIAVLSLTTGKTLTVKPSKIISGQEPEKTNELLQCLGQALKENLSTSEAVKKYKSKGNNKASNDNLPIKTKESVQNASLASNSTEKLSKRSENKKDENNKQDVNKKNKRDTSNSRNVLKKQKENFTTRKEIQQDKSKEIILKNKTATKQKSRDRIPASSPPKSLNNEKNNRSNLKIDIDQLEIENDEPTKECEELSNGKLSSSLNIHQENKTESDHENIHLAINGEEKVKNHKKSTLDDEDNTINPPLENIKSEPDRILENIKQSIIPEIKQEILNTNMNEDTKLIIETEKSVEIVPINHQVNKKDKNNHGDSEFVSKLTRNESSGSIYKPENSTKPSTPVIPSRSSATRPPSGRPPSARPGAPRLRDKYEDTIPTNESFTGGKVNIIMENSEVNAEDEEESLVIVEPGSDTLSEVVEDPILENTSGEHGHLVQQILESQKEFSQKTGKTEIEWQFGAHRSKEAFHQEVEQLRFNLQALSRTANPLGKLLDHVQEDVEVMRQELQQWTKTYEDAKTALAKEKSGMELSLQPLQAKSKQLDREIAEKREKINVLKSVIHKNTMRINKLLASGNVQ